MHRPLLASLLGRSRVAGRNGSGGRDGICWIDKEGDEDFTDSRLGRIFDTKRPNSVSVDVGESNATTLDGFDTSEVLNCVCSYC